MGLCFIIALFFCLYLWLWNNHFDKFKVQDEYIVEIISLKDEGSYSDRYEARILTGSNKNLRVFIYVYCKNDFCYGDILKVKGETKSPTQSRNNKDFNYSRYLKTRKVVSLVIADEIQLINHKNSIIAKIYKVKQSCANIIDCNFDNSEAQILKAMLLGEKDNISDEISEMFSKSGLNHILAISGFHVSYVVLYSDKLLNKLIKNIKLRYWLLIIFLIIYMIFTGSSPSSIRACIMAIMYYLSKILLKERDFYVSFLLSLFIVLILNPFNIFSMSMWFSFLGSLGIYLFGNAIHKLIRRKFPRKHKLIDWLLEVILVSVSAQILIFPILWKIFGTISLTFWISNLLTSPIIAPVLVLGYMSVFVFPFRRFMVFVESICLKLFLYIVLISSRIPFNRFFITKPSNFIIFIYYVIIFAFVMFYKKKKFTALKCMVNFNYLKKFLLQYRRIVKSISVSIMILVAVSMIIYIVPKDLRINFLSVGQGDCTLIRTKYNKVVLVDSGEGHSEKYDYGKQAVLPYLLNNHVSKIDYLIISHFDSDHSRRSILHIREF